MDRNSLRLLVFGATGQVGTALRSGRWPGVAVAALSQADVDLTVPAALGAAVRETECDVVVNAAAYTAVDRAEQEPEAAFAVNRDGPAHIAAACAAAGLPFIHISTDYVFDGTKVGAWNEDDPIHPLGVYGASKAAGEVAVRAALDRHVILRTSWVFAPQGYNFVRTMLRLAETRDRLRVVADQTGCPTAAEGLADIIVAVARRVAAGEGSWGTFHACGAPPTTWHAFAERIFEERRRLTGRPSPVVEAITTADYPTPARRPANSVLDGTRLAERYGLSLPDWRPALAATVEAILADL